MAGYLDIRTRAELRSWYEANAATAKEMYLPISMSWEPQSDIIIYVDAVEEALCFGWIDSVHKKIDGVLCSRFSPRRKGGNWTELNIARCHRLQRLGLMTPMGLATMPEEKPFIIPPHIELALKSDTKAWAFLNTVPDLYLRIKISNIIMYEKRGDKGTAARLLKNLVEYSAKGRLHGQWNDNGRLG